MEVESSESEQEIREGLEDSVRQILAQLAAIDAQPAVLKAYERNVEAALQQALRRHNEPVSVEERTEFKQRYLRKIGSERVSNHAFVAAEILYSTPDGIRERAVKSLTPIVKEGDLPRIGRLAFLYDDYIKLQTQHDLPIQLLIDDVKRGDPRQILQDGHVREAMRSVFPHESDYRHWYGQVATVRERINAELLEYRQMVFERTKKSVSGGLLGALIEGHLDDIFDAQYEMARFVLDEEVSAAVVDAAARRIYQAA